MTRTGAGTYQRCVARASAGTACVIARRGVPQEELPALAEALGVALSSAELAEAMVALDTSKDGRIALDELLAFWTRAT